ncbi:MAG: thiolase family protein [Acidobacteriota bacterium]|nr:thiolase family protein [Blastocatellia bacterium]MDW8413759.1 thiolase family protein [Acidobacteriota bacterium]
MVYVVAAVRSAIGKYGGSLKDLSVADMGAPVVGEVLNRAKVPLESVDEVIFGNARQAGGGPNVARQIAYRAGIPVTSPAYTVNQACGSGLRSIILAYQQILLGRAKCIVAGGGESMTRMPYYLESARWGSRLGHTELIDGMYRDGFNCPLAGMMMGETAEYLARQMEIERSQQDEYALRSQQLAAQAQQQGLFSEEICPLEIKTKQGMQIFAVDEHLRPETTLEGLAKLPPVFSKTGTVTAGNSSGITDGAAAVVLVSEAALKEFGCEPLARVVDYSIVGVEPVSMGIAPVPAVEELLGRTKLTLGDIDLIELNEAFAAQVLACLKKLPIPLEKLNVNGGSIALGHPIGCTGTRIVVTLLYEMRRRKVRYGIATLCISGGMGIALLLERV